MISRVKKIYGYYFPNKNPFSNAPYASEEEYMKIFNDALSKKYEKVREKCIDLGFTIDETYLNNLALSTQVVIKKSEINFQHGKLIYSILRNYIETKKYQNLIILETGTARGFSSICMSKALTDSKVNGKIYSIDYLPHNHAMYWNSISDHGGKLSRNDLLKNWEQEKNNIIFLEGKTKKILKKLDLERINFAFLDAAHTKKDVLHEFNYVKKRQINGDSIIFDDVTETAFPGVVEALNIIKQQGEYEIEVFNISKNRSIGIATKIIEK